MVDILLVGATGYSGRLVTRYLAAHRDCQAFSFGLAARSEAKLDELISSLSLPQSQSIKTFSVDVRDTASIEAVLGTARPRVVISTVGPYMPWGLPLARSCARAGIHYVDITGEGPYVMSLVNEVDYLASKTGSILIPCCGFDVVPFDVLAYLSARSLTENLPKDLPPGEDVGALESQTMWNLKGGGISGGTLASALAFLESPDRKNMSSLNYADYLSPMPATKPEWKLTYWFPPVAGLRDCGALTPFTPVNMAIVQRTRGLLSMFSRSGQSKDEEDIVPKYSTKYAYMDSIRCSNRVSAFMMSFGFIAGLTALLFFPPLRWLLRRTGYTQGQGMSDEVLEKGSFEGHNITVSTDIPGKSSPLIAESFLKFKGDPYLLTAVSVAEAGLSLLAPRESLPVVARSGGVFTSMSALGTNLLRRLSASGRFEFETGLRD